MVVVVFRVISLSEVDSCAEEVKADSLLVSLVVAAVVAVASTVVSLAVEAISVLNVVIGGRLVNMVVVCGTVPVLS